MIIDRCLLTGLSTTKNVRKDRSDESRIIDQKAEYLKLADSTAQLQESYESPASSRLKDLFPIPFSNKLERTSLLHHDPQPNSSNHFQMVALHNFSRKGHTKQLGVVLGIASFATWALFKQAIPFQTPRRERAHDQPPNTTQRVSTKVERCQLPNHGTVTTESKQDYKIRFSAVW